MSEEVSVLVDNFFSDYPQKNLNKGQILVFSGETSNTVYYLKKGRVKQYDVSAQGEEIVINIFKPGSFFPMSQALNGRDNPYIFEAETSVVIHPAPAADVVSFLKTNPEVMFDLLSRVYRGMDGTLERMVHLMKSSARKRLMFEIVINSLRFGHKNPDGSYVSHINEGDIADRAGLVRETVSREMSKLVKEKLVVFKKGRLTVTNIKKLEDEINLWN